MSTSEKRRNFVEKRLKEAIKANKTFEKGRFFRAVQKAREFERNYEAYQKGGNEKSFGFGWGRLFVKCHRYNDPEYYIFIQQGSYWYAFRWFRFNDVIMRVCETRTYKQLIDNFDDMPF